MMRYFWLLLVAVAGLHCAPAAAQVYPVGQCNDLTRGQSFVFYNNYYGHQIDNPANGGLTVRDPSFMSFLRIPAVDPQNNAYFVAWDGTLIEITRGVGSHQIGNCAFNAGFVQQNPFAGVYAPPVYSHTVFVQTPQGELPVPQAIAAPERPYGVPMLTTEVKAQQCYHQSGGDHTRFGDCMVAVMAGARERGAYECAKSNDDKSQLAICMVGVLGGNKERQIAGQLQQCQRQYGDDLSQYPLCLASSNADADTGRLIQCVQQQSGRGEVSVMGTAMCYGAGKLNLNTEMQIAVQCAVASGGEPMTFAGCTGGQLTANELNKCFTNGVGGSGGCFGPNNTIIQALQDAGYAIGQQFGPNNDLVKNWNNAVYDIQHGPGPNNDVVKVFNNVGNAIGSAPKAVTDAISKVVPKIRIKL